MRSVRDRQDLDPLGDPGEGELLEHLLGRGDDHVLAAGGESSGEVVDVTTDPAGAGAEGEQDSHPRPPGPTTPDRCCELLTITDGEHDETRHGGGQAHGESWVSDGPIPAG